LREVQVLRKKQDSHITKPITVSTEGARRCEAIVFHLMMFPHTARPNLILDVFQHSNIRKGIATARISNWVGFFLCGQR
jgi:hypothetical protein